MTSVSHLVLIEFVPKVNQIISNTQQTTTLYLNAIQRTVHNGLTTPNASPIETHV